MSDDDSSERQSEPSDAAAAALTPCTTIEEALARYGLSVPAEAIGPLDRYARLVWEWNEKLNLTRHTDYDRYVGRDVADAAQLSALLHPDEEVLDIGSGGGAPGIPLAILRPDLTITLTDSTQKKAAALKAMVKDLGLPIPVVADRAENVLEDDRFDATTARGVGALDKLLRLLAGKWLSVGRLLAFKGPKWREEEQIAREANLLRTLSLKVAVEYPMPGASAPAVVLKIWPQGGTER